MAIFRKIIEYANDEAIGFSKFLLLFVVGFFILFLGVMILMIAAVLSGGSASFGAVVFIGPFPIVIGVGPEATWIILFAIVLAVLTIIILFISRREAKVPFQ